MSRRARTLPYPDLFAGLEAPPPPVVAESALAAAAPELTPHVAPSARRQAVWLCLYFPALPLQAQRAVCATPEPAVVVNDDAGRTLAAVNRAAHRHGIFPGHKLKHAMALCADLTIVARDPAAEQALLEAVAQTLISFSPSVSLSPPQSLVLEVAGSLKLFGGIEHLLARLQATLREAGHHVRHSVAPTALAAEWLAGSAQALVPQDVVQHGVSAPGFQRTLHALDIGVTGWPVATLQALRAMGVTTLGDCRRLPRAGLSRRFGVSVLQSLAQAFGELPELRAPVIPPARFEDVLNLDAEIDKAPALATACGVLLARLEAFLCSCQGAVRRLQFVFHGWRGGAGELEVTLTQPGFRQAHWEHLLAAHLERCTLVQPVVAISLTVKVSDPLRAATGELAFSLEAAPLVDNGELHTLLDQFRARLGEAAVRTLQHVSTHRPEHASKITAPAPAEGSLASLPPAWLLKEVPATVSRAEDGQALLLQRPVWLLPSPRRLAVTAGRPDYHGMLVLQHGPERIESGWWETRSATRDYFIAENPAGMRLWIYRQWSESAQTSEAVAETDAVQWWLHGIFG
ncbi:MAG: DNA polymerase Y family protein [Pseudomonadota bacterium]